MAVSYIGYDWGAGNNAAVTTFIHPSTQVGDLLVAVCYIRENAATYTKPTGWNAWVDSTAFERVFTGGLGENSVKVFWRFYQSGDPSSFTFTPTGGGSNDTTLVQILTFRGVDTTTPFTTGYGLSTQSSQQTTLSLSSPSDGDTSKPADCAMLAILARDVDDVAYPTISQVTGPTTTWTGQAGGYSQQGTDATTWVWIGGWSSEVTSTVTIQANFVPAATGWNLGVSLVLKPNTAGGGSYTSTTNCVVGIQSSYSYSQYTQIAATTASMSTAMGTMVPQAKFECEAKCRCSAGRLDIVSPLTTYSFPSSGVWSLGGLQVSNYTALVTVGGTAGATYAYRSSNGLSWTQGTYLGTINEVGPPDSNTTEYDFWYLCTPCSLTGLDNSGSLSLFGQLPDASPVYSTTYANGRYYAQSTSGLYYGSTPSLPSMTKALSGYFPLYLVYNNGVYLTASTSTGFTGYISVDGTTFTETQAHVSQMPLQEADYTHDMSAFDGNFVALTGSYILTSSDGVTWSSDKITKLPFSLIPAYNHFVQDKYYIRCYDYHTADQFVSGVAITIDFKRWLFVKAPVYGTTYFAQKGDEILLAYSKGQSGYGLFKLGVGVTLSGGSATAAQTHPIESFAFSSSVCSGWLAPDVHSCYASASGSLSVVTLFSGEAVTKWAATLLYIPPTSFAKTTISSVSSFPNAILSIKAFFESTISCCSMIRRYGDQESVTNDIPSTLPINVLAISSTGIMVCGRNYTGYENAVFRSADGGVTYTEVRLQSNIYIGDAVGAEYLTWAKNSFFLQKRSSTNTIEQNSYMQSADGLTWTELVLGPSTDQALGVPYEAGNMIYHNRVNYFYGIYYYLLLYSTDGVSWTLAGLNGGQGTFITPSIGRVVYGNGVYLALTDTSASTGVMTDVIFYSYDGIAWDYYTLPFTVEYRSAIKYSAGRFVYLRQSVASPNYAYVSSDGLSWTKVYFYGESGSVISYSSYQWSAFHDHGSGACLQPYNFNSRLYQSDDLVSWSRYATLSTSLRTVLNPLTKDIWSSSTLSVNRARCKLTSYTGPAQLMSSAQSQATAVSALYVQARFFTTAYVSAYVGGAQLLTYVKFYADAAVQATAAAMLTAGGTLASYAYGECSVAASVTTKTLFTAHTYCDVLCDAYITVAARFFSSIAATSAASAGTLTTTGLNASIASSTGCSVALSTRTLFSVSSACAVHQITTLTVGTLFSSGVSADSLLVGTLTDSAQFGAQVYVSLFSSGILSTRTHFSSVVFCECATYALPFDLDRRSPPSMPVLTRDKPEFVLW